MKKWIAIFVAISAVVLLVVRSVAGEEISKNADFGKICDDGEYYSQIANCDGEDYVIYRNQEQQQAWVVNVDKNLYQYKALATVHTDRVFYLFSFMDDGQLSFGVEPAVLGDNEMWETPVFQAEGSLFAAGATEDEIFVSILGKDQVTVTEYILPLYYEDFYEWEEGVSFLLTEGHYPVGASYEEGELLIMQEDGTVYLQDIEVEEAGIIVEEESFATCFKKGIISGAEGEWLTACKNHEAVKNIPLVLMISVLVVFVFYGIRMENHFVYRMICGAEITAVVAIVLLGSIFEEQLVKQEVLEKGIEAGYVLEELKLQQNEDETIDTEIYLEAVRREEAYLEDLIIMEPETGEVILAKTLPQGMSVYDKYGEECKALVERVAQSHQAVMLYLEESGSHDYIVSSRNWTQIDAKSVLLAVIPKIGIEKNVGSFISSMWNTIFITILVMTVVHIGLFFFFSIRWKRFLEGMQYVATQKKAYKEFPTKNDGLYGAWTILERIGHNTGKLQYEQELLYKKYHRFVPKGMEQLLRKPEIAEINIGDSNLVCGCMVDFHIENNKEKEDGSFGTAITESMKLTHKIRKRYEGIFISSNEQLGERKIFFEQAPAEAVQFATDLCWAHGGSKELGDCEVTMVLQYGDYQYGVTGVEDLMTPYMYCKEDSISETLKKALGKAKVKIALTEQTVQAMGSGFAVRYLGFVPGESKENIIRLYECLEGYDKEKRKIMQESESVFQKALNMFYTDEFYAARNLFHEVLKMNEQDEISRWYLLRCESLMKKDKAEVTYGLFDDYDGK